MVSRTENGIILPPIRQVDIPKTAQWLAGQGCGSWFNIKYEDVSGNYIITRLSPEGKKEFKGEFRTEHSIEFCIDCPFSFTYLSHFKECNILQHGQKIKFKNIIFD